MLKRSVAGLVVALVCGVSVSGCGDDKQAAARPEPTPSASLAPTEDPTLTKPPIVPPTLPTATKGKRGQEAFATHVVGARGGAPAAHDPQPGW